MKTYEINLDFDGTVVEHQYPNIGRANFGCIEVLMKLQNAGHKIVLNTTRSEISPEALHEAIRWFDYAYRFLVDAEKRKKAEFNFALDGVLNYKMQPGLWDWQRFKAEGVIMLDDQCYGIPLKKAAMSTGNMVDWAALDIQFAEQGLY